MTTKIRIKFKDRNKQIPKAEVTALAYGQCNVPFTRLYVTPEGYKAVCRDDTEAERLLSNEAREIFYKAGLIIVIPPEMTAKRTLFIRQLDHSIGSRSADDIKSDIENRNDWLTVDEVTKIKDYTHVIKVRFANTNMVETVLQRGLLIGNMSVTPEQMNRETFVNLLTCFKCYVFEDHATKDCPHEYLVVCSECSCTGHKYTECESEVKKCINCTKLGYENTNHRTLAMACPYKKMMIKDKLKSEQENEKHKQKSTYVEIAKQAIAEATKPEEKTQLILSEPKHYKLLCAIMHAHIANICNPGCYATELNLMLQKNGLETMWFPEDPDSSKLLQATATPNLQEYMSQKSLTETSPIVEQTKQIEKTTAKETKTKERPQEQQQTSKQTQQKPQEQRDPRIQRRDKKDTSTRPKQKLTTLEEETEEDMEITTSSTLPQPQTAKDIGLKIHVTGKSVFPTSEMTTKEILMNIENKNYKWTYTDRRYRDEYIWTLMARGLITITTTDFRRDDDAMFRKIRNGLIHREYLESESKQRKE